MLIDRRWLDVARSFGAGRLDLMLTVVLPALAYCLKKRSERRWAP